MDKHALDGYTEIDKNIKSGMEMFDRYGKNHFDGDYLLIMDFSPYVPHIIVDKTLRTPQHMVMLVTEGHLTLEVSLESFTLSRGSVMLIPSNSVLATKSYSQDCNYRSISFDVPSIEVSAMIGYRPQHVHVSDKGYSMADSYFSLMDQLVRRKEEIDTMAMEHLVLSLVYYVLSLHEDRLRQQGQLDMPKPMRVKNEFLYLLNKEPFPERSVVYYAEQLGVSPAYLNNAMKKTTGKRPLDWINVNTVKAARLLLCEGGGTIDEIARKLHFADGATFTKFYKHHTGETPTAFRRRVTDE